ncbi:hypothetical protein NK8_83030 (plasmid) [Caballeronia sp. NK8]|nr:hypothetical protein NK8_83030 [Caballeronia sp. NK8]
MRGRKRLGAGLLHLRIASRERDAQLCARLDHAQTGDLQVAVAGIGLFHQAFEILVAEDSPPLPDIGLRRLLRDLF